MQGRSRVFKGPSSAWNLSLEFIRPASKQFVLLPMLWGEVPGSVTAITLVTFPCEP